MNEFQEDDAVTYLKRAIQVIKSMSKEGLETALCGFGRTLDSQAVINSINDEGFKWVSIDVSLLNNFIANKESQEKVQELFALWINQHGITDGLMVGQAILR